MLLIFGLGYVGNCVKAYAESIGIEVYGTKISVSPDPKILQLSDYHIDDRLINLLPKAKYILVTIPPINNQDIIVKLLEQNIARLKNLEWLGYCSATNVYGDYGGEWVDENSLLKAQDLLGINRINAENLWLDLYTKYSLPVHIFRLSGIYGPGRSVIDNLLNGTAKRIHKKGQFFSRIYIDDIVEILIKSIQNPSYGDIYNLADEYPCSTQEVLEYGCDLLKIAYPKLIDYDNLEQAVLPYFFRTNKKISNLKVKSCLNYELKFPSYREGIEEICRVKGLINK